MAAAAPVAKPPPVKIDEPEELKSKGWSGMELESGTSTKDVAADSAFERVFERLYGKMTFEEKLRLIWLAGTLFFIIGGYWLLRSLKDPVIATICGVEYIPKAKMLSVLVVLVLVFVYNKLIDMFPKHQLFYIVGGFYAGLFTLIACLLATPATAQTSIYNTNASPYRLIGWISYCSIESFGSIGVSLFWAFTNSTYNLEGAKKAYGLMVACAQLGSIAGPTLVSVGTEAYGVPTIYCCGALCMVAMVVSIYGYNLRFPQPPDSPRASTKKKSSAGMTEGLVLFWKYHYVKGIFGQAANGLSFCFSLLGTSMVIRRLGLNRTLLLFPTLCLGAICFVYTTPTLEAVFLAMLLLKGFSYCLNNPCKEILYQPTSSNVKFKAKSWIDVFGARGSKALGSVVTNAFSDSAADLLSYGAFVGMSVASFLIYVAWWQGREFDNLIDGGVKLGEEPEPVPSSAADDDGEGTSCGLEEEDDDGGVEEKKSINV